MATFYTGGSSAVIAAGAANDLEIVGGSLRLRPRPSHTPANRAALVIDCNQRLPVIIDGVANTYGTPAFRDLAGHVNAGVFQAYARESYKRFAADEVAYTLRSVSSHVRVDPVFATDDDAFTVDLEFRLSSVVAVCELMNVYAMEAADRSWKLTYNGDQTITWTLYGAADATRTLTIDCSAWPLLISTWYDLRISYNLAGPEHAMEIRRPSDDARIIGTATDTIELQKPVGFARPGLVIGGLPRYVESVGLDQYKNAINPLIQRLTYYRSHLGTGLYSISGRPTFYSTALLGNVNLAAASITLDSGVDDSVWEMATLAADNEDAFAAVGGYGYKVTATGSNNAVPPTPPTLDYWTGLKGAAAKTGRYLHISLGCSSDGYNEYYPLSWISCEATVSEAPAATTLDAAALVTEGVEVTFTPPATGDYTTTNFYYRVKGAVAWTLIGASAGEQGVASTATVAVGAGGLPENYYYEFIAVSVSAYGYGPPSVVRHLYVHSGDAMMAALAAVAAELTADATLAGYVDVVNVQEWDVERLPAFADVGLVITPVSRTPEQIALKSYQDIAEIAIHCLTVALDNEDGLDAAEGVIQLAGDVFRCLNGNDCGGTIVPVTGNEAANRVPYEKIRDGYYHHAVFPLRVYLPLYTQGG